MGWMRKGRKDYYYRSKRVGRGVTNIYFGSGPEAAVAAALDAQRRNDRKTRAEATQAELDRLQPVDAMVVELDELTSLLVRVVLVSAGFHQHRGSWRKRRHGRSQEQSSRCA